MNAWAVIFEAPQSFPPMAAVQEELAAARFEDRIPDTFLFLEHEPVVTLGRRGRTEHLLMSPEELAARGIALHQARRGGDVTYHGPGQLVMYPILRLGALRAGARGYLDNLEEVAIRTCAHFGVAARRVPGKSGAWTDHGKIAAIGFHLRRGITLHGMSFNVCPDLSGFETIVPCGLRGDPVTSLHTILGDHAPTFADVLRQMMVHVEQVFERHLETQHLRMSAWYNVNQLMRPDQACTPERRFR